MKINRHNYEEYFILYLDKELSAEDRQLVESFVQLHPDLKDELELLQQTQFSPDKHIVFDSKDDLLFGQAAGIRESNSEEWLVQYIDNELNQEQRAMVEKFVATNADAQNDLAILLKTKLQPETIVFKNKESLYRREERTRRIIGWQIAAAAVLLLMATAGIVIFNKPGKPDIEIAGGPNNNIKQVQPNNNIVPNTAVEKENTLAIEDKLQGKKENIAPAIAQQKKNDIVPVKDDKNEVNIIKEEQKKELLADNTPKSNNLPKREVNDPAPVQKEDAIIAKIEPQQQNSNNSTVTEPPRTSYSNSKNATPEIVEPVFASDDGRKNKLRGFFRKVTRTLEKRTNIETTDEDERLLIAGLAIKLK